MRSYLPVVRVVPSKTHPRRLRDSQSGRLTFVAPFNRPDWLPLGLRRCRKPYPIPDQNGRSLPVFRRKRLKNPTLWGSTNLYGLYKGVPPPPRRSGAGRGSPDPAVPLPFSRESRTPNFCRRHPEKRFLSQPHIGAQILANPASPGSWQIPHPVNVSRISRWISSNPASRKYSSRPSLAFTWIVGERVVKGIGTLIFIIDHDALGFWLWLLTPSLLKQSLWQHWSERM